MNLDQIEIEILVDGTIKMSTDKISAPNHGNAEMLLREIEKMAGNKMSRTAKPGHRMHSHTNQQGQTITHSH